jgi:hypothetical protein
MIQATDNTRLIPLGNGRDAIIDAADYDRPLTISFPDGSAWTGRICDCSWYAVVRPTVLYANAHVTVNGKQRTIAMHRMLLELSPFACCDHRNHDGLDNRRENLRAVTRAQNQWNKRNQAASSPYKGVWFEKHAGKWRARIMKHGKNRELGLFLTAEDAARAYNAAAVELFGEYAVLNAVA